MGVIEGLFFLLLSVILLIFVYTTPARGWVPFGVNPLRGKINFERYENPFGFWLVLSIYGCLSLALLVVSILIIFGIIPPLPLASNHPH